MKKKIFDKEYKYTFTKNNFIITKINKTNPITFKLKDQHGDHLNGSFYEAELQEVSSRFKIKKKYFTRKRLTTSYTIEFNGKVTVKDITLIYQQKIYTRGQRPNESQKAVIIDMIKSVGEIASKMWPVV